MSEAIKVYDTLYTYILQFYRNLVTKSSDFKLQYLKQKCIATALAVALPPHCAAFRNHGQAAVWAAVWAAVLLCYSLPYHLLCIHEHEYY